MSVICGDKKGLMFVEIWIWDWQAFGVVLCEKIVLQGQFGLRLCIWTHAAPWAGIPWTVVGRIVKIASMKQFWGKDA